jgi:hypothetical protein
MILARLVLYVVGLIVESLGVMASTFIGAAINTPSVK